MYRQGWFPMGRTREGPTEWVQPYLRSVLPLEEGRFRVKRSLRQLVKQTRFEIRCDTAFEQVIGMCRDLPRTEDTWITPDIVELFVGFYRAGVAHSVEAWTRESSPQLVGGLYGVDLGGVFCGESMFSRIDLGGSGASQACLVHLVGHLRRCGFELLDTQISNPHVEQFGTEEWPAERYLDEVKKLSRGRGWAAWDSKAALMHVSELRG